MKHLSNQYPKNLALMIFIIIFSNACNIFDPETPVNFDSPDRVNNDIELRDDTSSSFSKKDETPDFLLTAWIWPIASNNMRTYDFTQMQAAGKRTVEIRAWQQIGTLGWQSNQQYTAAFEADSNQISLVSPTGYREFWEISEVNPSYMKVTDTQGRSYYWFNCKEPGWPPLIHASMRSCK